MEHAEAVNHARRVVSDVTGFQLPPQVVEAAVNAYLNKMQMDRPEPKPRNAMEMTPKQKELLSFIRLYCTEQGGISPSYDEMKDFMGLNSKSGIHRIVTALEERGLIRRLENRARSIVVVGEPA